VPDLLGGHAAGMQMVGMMLLGELAVGGGDLGSRGTD
jgi:hypothetical protein